jgi:hypothetical protein
MSVTQDGFNNSYCERYCFIENTASFRDILTALQHMSLTWLSNSPRIATSFIFSGTRFRTAQKKLLLYQ